MGDAKKEIEDLLTRMRSNEFALNLVITGYEGKLLLDEIERLRAERRKLFDLVSSFKSPLFELRMQTVSTQGRIDDQIYQVRKAWFEEHGHEWEKEPVK